MVTLAQVLNRRAPHLYRKEAKVLGREFCLAVIDEMVCAHLQVKWRLKQTCLEIKVFGKGSKRYVFDTLS